MCLLKSFKTEFGPASFKTLVQSYSCSLSTSHLYFGWYSAAQLRSPGRQMRPINHPGDPESRRGWSGGRLTKLRVIYHIVCKYTVMVARMRDTDLMTKDLSAYD